MLFYNNLYKFEYAFFIMVAKNHWIYIGCIDPLEYYFIHWEEHCLMGRTELHKADSGLGRSLLSYWQMGQAIPEIIEKREGRPPLSQKKRQKILEMYLPCGKNARLIGERVGCCRDSALNLLKEAGLETLKRGKPKKAKKKSQ